MTYQPIEDYGVIGNLRTAALIGKNGSIDWFCYPHFDSPSVFGSILDEHKGGYFRIAPNIEEISRKQVYWPDTNVLVTRFLAVEGVGEIIDYMPVGAPRPGDGAQHDPYYGLIRMVKVVRGSMRFRLECIPAFNYGRDTHTLEIIPEGARFSSVNLRLGLSSPIPFQSLSNGATTGATTGGTTGDGVTGEFSLNEGESLSFELHALEDGGHEQIGLPQEVAHQLFHDTIHFWRHWIAKCTYRGRWRETVHRSALVLKLLTFEPTGAIVAAPTCSLPESIGGQRNWDYRYTWIRDAAFTIYSLMRIGFTEEAAQFVAFLDARCHEMEPDGSLQTMYGIDGRHVLTEETLDQWEGYRQSNPVRIGNAAYEQLQLDIYGELMDSLYLYNKYGTPISFDLWRYLRRLTDWVCRHWKDKDDAIWEVRGGPREFVYSKMMSWVAVDRALRLAGKRSFPADWTGWTAARDEMYETIMNRGWNPDRGAFVQQFDGDAVDASTLLMPLVFFVSPTDPRMLRTIDAINQPPKSGGLVSDGLVYRYDVARTPDGLKGTEGTFNLCTFWLVEALTRASANDPQRLYQARLLFEQMLGYANHLGLYSEQIGPQGQALGNFPQALTHLALISAAFNLDRYLDGLEKTPPVR
ncbi:MAG: glycoside hydrolase family 15 protein [Bryobacterales bacterium]|nr:glycoside hydrolase family 15 protein [Bryobacterales bacterium]